jgi:hypothetical protein
MGLDMYAYEVSPSMVVDDFNYKSDKFTNSIELQYWRKNRHLHNWMEALYRKKGGTAESFNCVDLRLTLEDLEALEKDILKENLCGKSGFFFGDNDYNSYCKEQDIDFVYKAKKAIALGSAIYYTSWW